MAVVTAPTFLEAPENVTVKCEQVTSLGGDEVACYIVGLNKQAVVIVSSRYLNQNRVSGLWVGEVQGQGKLVDFPSGDRLLLDPQLIEAVNGNPFR